MILMGDFNCIKHSLSYKKITAFLSDTCPTDNNIGTLHGYQKDNQSMNMKKIDYIFCSKGAEPVNYQVVREKCWNSQFGEDFFASDHHPVYSTCDFSWFDDGVDFDGGEYSVVSEDGGGQSEGKGEVGGGRGWFCRWAWTC